MYVDTRYFYVRPPRTLLVWTVAVLLFASGVAGGWWLGHEPQSEHLSSVVVGRVVTTDGVPVKGATVEFLGRTIEGDPVALLTGTDDAGRYRLPHVPVPVAYVTRVRCDDAGVLEQHSMVAESPGATLTSDMTVSPTNTVRGQIVDALDLPVPRAMVMAVVAGGEGQAEVVHGMADADGRYLLRFSRKPDAGLHVAAVATGYLPALAAAGAPTQRLGTQAFGMNPIVLTLAGSAEGRVLDENGVPVADAEVQVRALLDPATFTPWTEDVLTGCTALGMAIDPAPTEEAHAVARFRTRTDSNGAFQVTVPLPAETVHFVVRARDREPSVTTIATGLLGRGSVVEEARTLRVGPSHTVKLRFERDGAPLPAAQVLFQDQRLHPVHQLNSPCPPCQHR